MHLQNYHMFEGQLRVIFGLPQYAILQYSLD